MKNNWSEFQKAIFNDIENSDKNLAISAVAGSGKTTTIVEAATTHIGSKKALFLAFNKSIVNELTERMSSNPNVACKTLHAHGLRALRSLKVNVNEREFNEKLFNDAIMLSSVIDIDSKNDIQYSFKSNIKKLFQLCRINLIKANEIDLIDGITDTYNIECVADEVEVTSQLLIHAYDYHTLIDFTDMIVLPLSYKKNIEKYDIVFIDECQDLSKAQRELMLASIKKGGKFIAVGDRKQAINGFAGASCDSFDKIANLPNTKELPLSVNYRCGYDIIKIAQQIVPSIKAHDNAEQGKVEHVYDMKKVTIGDMVLCRKSAPLVGLCLKMLANGMRANVKGKDLGVGLANLVKKLKAKNLNSLFLKLDNEKEKLHNLLVKKNIKDIDNHPKMITFLDKVECLKAISESVTSISQLLKKLDEIFSDLNTKNSITLSTVHKSKGLESDNVFIIIPNKLPLTFPTQKAWEFEQEMNLKYVAVTRAKKNLYFVDLDEDAIKRIEF